MASSGNYIVESDVDNWDMPVGLGEEFATTAVNISTDIITVTHDIPTGTECHLTSTGTLPAGISTETLYWIKRESATTIKVCNSPMNAAAGTKIDMIDVGTGIHTIWIDYSQTFATTDVTVATDKITVTNNIDTGTKVRFTSSGDTVDLPAPLVEGTEYFAINVDTTHITIATSGLDAAAGTYITITDVGSGTHSIFVGEGQTEYDRQQVINQVEDLIYKITDDYFSSTAFVTYHNGTGNDYLDLGHHPKLLTVTEVKISGVALDTTWYTINDVAIYIDPEAVTGDADDLPELHLRLKYERTLFPKGIGNIKVTGTYGHSTTPPRIKQATIILCRAENDPTLYPSYDIRIKSEKLGDYSRTLSDAAYSKNNTGIDEVDELLKDYIVKRPIFGAV